MDYFHQYYIYLEIISFTSPATISLREAYFISVNPASSSVILRFFSINSAYTCTVSILINTAPKRPASTRPAPKSHVSPILSIPLLSCTLLCSYNGLRAYIRPTYSPPLPKFTQPVAPAPG